MSVLGTSMKETAISFVVLVAIAGVAVLITRVVTWAIGLWACIPLCALALFGVTYWKNRKASGQ